MPSPIEPLLTPAEVIQILRVPRSTLDRLRRAGHVRAVRIGGGVRYRTAEVERFLAEASSEGVSAGFPASALRAPAAPTSGRPAAYRIA